MKSIYHKRNFYSLADWTIGDHRLKAYGISAPDDGRIDAPLLDAARLYTERTLGSAAQIEGESGRLGYVVIHRGSVGVWLLIHWWAHGDICCGRLALAATGTTLFETMEQRPLLACVWEQLVMQHERDAWVRHMMKDDQDSSGYLHDRLADGLC